MNHELTCRHCGETQTIAVSAEAYQAWQGGEFIQNAMPELTEDEREMFISQTCSVCWDNVTFPWLQ